MSDVKKRLPINGTFELTGRCNLSCKMCLVRVDQKRIDELGYRERSADEWIHMAEQAAGAGTLSLLLTGGEVMIRPDFCEIYEAVAKIGFILTVYTNATMVTDKVMELFQKYPPHKIGVTMYGASNETYARLCGCKDGYDRFMVGLEKLSSLPSLLEMRTTIVKDNLQDLEEMRSFTKEKFGEKRILQLSRFVTKSIRGGVACAEHCRLDPEENVGLVNRSIVELYRKAQRGEIHLPEPEEKLKLQSAAETHAGGYLFKNCEAGARQYTITWNGNMYACELMPRGCTKPFDTGFGEAWEKLPECYPDDRVNEKCAGCKYSPYCEVCPAIRYAETADFFGIPDYFCREAKYMYRILTYMNVI